MPIPRLIHRLWLDDPLPEPFEANADRWAALHPGWTVTDWLHSADLPRLRNQQLVDRAQQHYPTDWKRFTADLVRLELLWAFGGVYVDTDVTPHQHIGPLLEGRLCVVGRSPQHRWGRHPITNAVMAAEPGHPYIDALICRIPAAVREYGHLPLARSVGPWHLTRTYDSTDWPNVTVLDHKTLYGGDWLVHSWNNAARKRGEGVW